jgi:hypothetical protein
MCVCGGRGEALYRNIPFGNLLITSSLKEAIRYTLSYIKIKHGNMAAKFFSMD